MIDKKPDKIKAEHKPRDDGLELENQFILRVPEEVAKEIHEALQTGNLRDRLTIKIDNDVRYGEVRFDQTLLYGKIVDLPTIIECLKTIDNKNFYKSADICQVMICKHELEDETEKESPNKGKKKDPNKVDRKYLWPHGITPPCKNVRKRRFRKTLKKKNVEAPEIEKEVKHLLRIDNDAVKVEFDILNEDMEKPATDQQAKDQYGEYNYDNLNDGDLNKSLNENSSQKDINIESEDEDDSREPISAAQGLAEHDIFGEELSSSDDEMNDETRRQELDDNSQLSADDSHMSESYTGGNNTEQNGNRQAVTEFNKSMFQMSSSPKHQADESNAKFEYTSSNLNTTAMSYDDDYSNDQPTQLSAEQINNKMADLKRQLNELKMQHIQKAQEISSIQNPTLRQRLQETLDNLLTQMLEKELELKDYEGMI